MAKYCPECGHFTEKHPRKADSGKWPLYDEISGKSIYDDICSFDKCYQHCVYHGHAWPQSKKINKWWWVLPPIAILILLFRSVGGPCINCGYLGVDY